MKIYIFGTSGSGKTTLARKIAVKLGIAHFDLDEIFWSFEKGKKNEAKRFAKILELTSEKEWIIEGMYKGKCLDKAIFESNYVFILNPPKFTIYWRIIIRTIFWIIGIQSYERKSSFKLLLKLFKTANHFEKKRLPQFVKQVEELNKKVCFVQNEKELLKQIQKF